VERKKERKEKGKKIEEISQDEGEKISEEERRKIMKEMKREKYGSYSSHDSCKSLIEEFSAYYRGRHRSHTKHHSQRRENVRRTQEVNISLPYFHESDNVEAYLDWEMKVENSLLAIILVKRENFHLLPSTFKCMPSSGGLLLLGNEGFMRIL